VSLDSLIHKALLALDLPEDAEDHAASEARREVFFQLGALIAEARGRSATSGDPRRTGFIGTPPATSEEQQARVRDVLAAGLDPGTLGGLEPEVLITAYEGSLSFQPGVAGGGDPSRRQGKGAFYTPQPVVEGLLDDALEPVLAAAGAEGWLGEVRICDPACGAGAFLVGAHRRLTAALVTREGMEPSKAAAHAARTGLVGVDIDRPAVEVARLVLWLQTELAWSALRTITGLRVANALLGAVPRVAEDSPSVGQIGLFAPPAARVRGEDAWCREHAPDLADQLFHWHLELPEVFSARRGAPRPETGLAGGFDVVVGNPPFLNQLRTSSAHARQVRALLEGRFDGQVRGYADAAAAFLLLSVDLLRPDGRCCLVLPVSFLAARDTAGARERVCERTRLAALWIATERVFESAAVFVFAPTLEAGGPRQRPVRRRRDIAFEPVPSVEVDVDQLASRPSWSPLVADIFGIPTVSLPEAGPTVESLAVVTADFRDQFYGLRGFVVEDADLPEGVDRAAFPRLVTTGLVDPAVCFWGSRETRFDRQRWSAPRVDLVRLEAEGEQGPWARSRMTPKVLLATQTSALEAVVDGDGTWIPSIPLISVVPGDTQWLWHLAAALVSPPLTAHAAATWLGAAMTVRAIKLSARQVRSLPLPTNRQAWSRGAEAFRQAQASPSGRQEWLYRCGQEMCEAYGVEGAERARLLDWWKPAAGL